MSDRASRASAYAQAGDFGPPCDRPRYVTVELHGQEVVAHPAVAPLLVRAVVEAHRILVCAGLGEFAPQRIDSYACRPIRAKRWSMHAYGLAWDVFRTPPGMPPPGGVWNPTAALHPLWISTLESYGFTWGGRWRRIDTPHFEWASARP